MLLMILMPRFGIFHIMNVLYVNYLKICLLSNPYIIIMGHIFFFASLFLAFHSIFPGCLAQPNLA
jgi:hypothetical protein